MTASEQPKRLTSPQAKALAYLATVDWSSPYFIAEAMATEAYRRFERPSSQGYGRIGGTMAHRLIKMKLAKDVSEAPYYTPRYSITEQGRRALKDHDDKRTARG